MSLRERFVCQSAACRREIEVERLLDQGAGQSLTLRCTCGGMMKKVYSKPVLREVSRDEAILRFDDRPAHSIEDCPLELHGAQNE